MFLTPGIYQSLSASMKAPPQKPEVEFRNNAVGVSVRSDAPEMWRGGAAVWRDNATCN